jgi:hypothetical protein
VPEDEPLLVARMIDLASEYGRDGYRPITAMLRREGWRVDHKRVERPWRPGELKVPLQTTAPRSLVVQRRVVYSAAAGIHGPCVVKGSGEMTAFCLDQVTRPGTIALKGLTIAESRL